MSAAPLILASQSQARISMLKNAGYVFDVKPADIDEDAIRTIHKDRTPDKIALILAQEKAKKISQEHKDVLVIGSDQICALEDQIFSKAKDTAQAFEKLKTLQGQTHQLHSAVSLHQNGAEIWSYCETVNLTMRPMTDEHIHFYIEQAGDAVTACAGAYAIESIGIRLFERINGDYFCILGMPLLPLIQQLDTCEVAT